MVLTLYLKNVAEDIPEHNLLQYSNGVEDG